jgi:hypothetical protein
MELTLGLIQVGFVSSKIFISREHGKNLLLFLSIADHMLIGQSKPVVPIGP